MRLLLSALAILLWLILGFFVQPCWETCCASHSSNTLSSKDTEVPTNSSDIKSASAGPLLFQFDKKEPLLGKDWESRKSSIIEGLKENDILEITGQYRATEINSSSFENLGLARASEIAKLFVPPLDSTRIKIRGELVNEDEGDKTSPFKSASFRNLKNTESIKEIDNKTLIYFPVNSVNKLSNTEIESYLNDVAERVIKTKETVRLTGHTDSDASFQYNLELGQRRANMVKQYLIDKGVPENQIRALTKGESQPIAPNETPEGKAKNRRTELEIIK